MKHRSWIALALAGAGLAPSLPGALSAQALQDSEHYHSVLEDTYPELYDLLVRLERIHGLLFANLAREGETVRASGDDFATFEFEFAMIDRLIPLAQQEGRLDEVAEEAEQGFQLLGPRAARVIARGNAFHREVLGILVDAGVEDVRATLAEAVERYGSDPQYALPAQPKDMDILYEHPYALDFRTGYTDLDGIIWAGHWLKLAATEPLTDIENPAEQAAGIDTVAARYYSKLSFGEPPQFFPSEVPLGPAIAPGLIWASPEAAMIWDNLTMMQEVLADVLASPRVTDLRSALDGAVEVFMDSTFAMTDRDDWEVMALQHGIFFQGGFPLAVMTRSERNAGGHAAHLAGGGGGSPIPFLGRMIR